MKKIISFVIFALYMVCIANAQPFTTTQDPLNAQYYEPSFGQFYADNGIDYTTFWPDFKNSETCQGNDFFVTIVPLSCSPRVIRSDLLEDQNVPVFCRLSAVRVNPLMEIAEVKSVAFSGNYPKEVVGVSYHPSKALLKSYNPQLGSGIINDLGYVVILLKQQQVEKNIPDFVNFTLAANIVYDLKNIQGIGKATFLLPVLTNEEWNNNYLEYSFWNNKGYIRAENVENDKARISIYSGQNNVIRSFDLKKGETSSIMYLPGFYCQGGLQIKLDDISTPKKSALLQIDNEMAWVTEGSSFLDSCTVDTIDRLGLDSRVVVRCEGKSYELRVREATKAKLGQGQFGSGEKVGTASNKDVYLAYIDAKGSFVILVQGISASYLSNNQLAGERLRAVYAGLKEVASSGDEAIKTRVASSLGITIGDVYIVRAGQSALGFHFSGLSATSDQDYTTNAEAQAAINKNFSTTRDIVYDLADSYPQDSQAGTIFGASALVSLAKLAVSINKFEAAKEIYNKIIEKYPDTEYSKNAQQGLTNLAKYTYLDASSTIFVKRVPHTIFLEEIDEPSAQEAGAVFVRGSTTIELLAGETRDLGNGESIRLNSIIDESRVTVDYVYKFGERSESVSNKEVRETELVPGTNIILQQVNFKRVAGIELLPNFPNSQAKSNFSISLSIEKRSLELSPEKTQKKINGLNDTIKKYQELSDKLNKTTDSLSKACFTASTVLLLKNFMQNAGGKGMARNHVMTDAGGWNDYCNQNLNNYGGSFQNCISANSDKIDAAITSYTQRVQTINNMISNSKTTPEDGIKQGFSSFVQQNPGTSAKIGDQTYNLNSILGITPSDNAQTISNKVNDSINKGILSVEDMKNIMLYGGISNDAVSSIPDFKNDALGNTLRSMETSKTDVQATESLQSLASGMGASSFNVPADAITGSVSVFTVKGVAGLDGETATLYLAKKTDGTSEKVLITLLPVSAQANSYTIKNVYQVTSDGKVNTNPATQSNYNLPPIFTKSSSESCSNQYITPKVKMYETGTYKGKAQLVPVDTKRGWYAATKPAIYGAGKPYADSGQVLSMWLCNVGKNGREEFDSGSSDDKCTEVNFQTGQPLGQIPCLTSTEANNLVRQAKSYLESASSQYGKTSVSVGSGTFLVSAASAITGAKCTDFMSPTDCKIMFNLCDPIICPNSRCNLGGKYTVPDVIQSGIIGSLVLCLPNIKEGIYFPICLTGVREGVKSYVSILTSYRDCLQEKLNTGKSIGVCDEVYSFYSCDFFWRQAGPLIDVGLVKILEAFYSQGKGGGEYLTVNNAWDNMKASVSYIQNFYASAVPKAFNTGTVSQIGQEECKNFLSTNYPVIGDLADTLLTPESPAQYQAWFDEISFSEATVPPTSQYKVFYHIYAGTSTGSQYSVYLKNVPATGYYAQQPEKVIDSGYITVGQTIEQTKDFTAPSGYKEVCIMINGQEKCGFQRVTTDFALNYLNDKYMQSQATQTVTSESQCISGTSSIYSLAQPNLQAGAEELIQSQIYERGIIRVCSNDNPGLGSTPGRWRDVGYCDQSRGIKCWLDTQSISKAIEGAGIENDTLGQIDQIARDIGRKEGTIDTPATTNSNLDQIIQKVGALKQQIAAATSLSSIFSPAILANTNEVNQMITEVVSRGYTNQQKANALYLKSQIYQTVVEKIRDLNQKAATPTTGVPSTTPGATTSSVFRDALAGKILFWAETTPTSGSILNYQTAGTFTKRSDGTLTITFTEFRNAISALTGTKEISETQAKQILCSLSYAYTDKGQQSTLYPLVTLDSGKNPSGTYLSSYQNNPLCKPATTTTPTTPTPTTPQAAGIDEKVMLKLSGIYSLTNPLVHVIKNNVNTPLYLQGVNVKWYRTSILRDATIGRIITTGGTSKIVLTESLARPYIEATDSALKGYYYLLQGSTIVGNILNLNTANVPDEQQKIYGLNFSINNVLTSQAKEGDFFQIYAEHTCYFINITLFEGYSQVGEYENLYKNSDGTESWDPKILAKRNTVYKAIASCMNENRKTLSVKIATLTIPSVSFSDVIANRNLYYADISSTGAISGYTSAGTFAKKSDGTLTITFTEFRNAIENLTGTKNINEAQAKQILCSLSYNYFDKGSQSNLYPIVALESGKTPSGNIQSYPICSV